MLSLLHYTIYRVWLKENFTVKRKIAKLINIVELYAKYDKQGDKND